MAGFCHFLCGGGVHQVFQQKKLLMKMADGFLQRAAMSPAVSEGSGNTDSADRVQPVSVLHNLPFKGTWLFSFVFAEGYAVYRRADCLCAVRVQMLPCQKGPGVGIVFCGKQLVIIRVVQEGSQRYRS